MQGPRTSIRFLGATRTVTGSRFLVESGEGRILVDCGMYQGERDLRRRNWAPFPVPAEEIDAVVLSHAHLDHCGWLPRLVRNGYAGPVLCSEWTARVAPIVLRDAAHLQEEDAEHAARYGYSKHSPPLPLFTTADAERAISLLKPVANDSPYPVAGASVTLRRAGHILGSTTVQVQTADASMLFSGDLGRVDHPLLKPPAPAPAVDVIAIESTYGDRLHPPRSLESLAEKICEVFDRGGIVLAPAFAIDRTEVLLMALRSLTREGKIPKVPVFVDSPMALAAMEIYTEAVHQPGDEIRDDAAGMNGDPFDPGDLRIARSVEESKQIDHAHGPCIIISAAGMATGGRVLHHLVHRAPDPKNLILLPGFQVPGTRGRALMDGATALKMFGGYVPVRAEVSSVEGLSAHADADGLIAWLRTAPEPPRTCYVVHGEEGPAAALARRITTELGWCAVVPRHAERVLV